MDEARMPLNALSKTRAQDRVVMIKETIKQHTGRKNVARPNPRKVMRRVARDIREVNPRITAQWLLQSSSHGQDGR
ncbi:unnamed protein product [Calypogeia fissa]